jgi:predicted GTPase
MQRIMQNYIFRVVTWDKVSQNGRPWSLAKDQNTREVAAIVRTRHERLMTTIKEVMAAVPLIDPAA